MRIDMKRAAEVNQRRGMTWRTLLTSVWFIICLIVAYAASGLLISSQKLSPAVVYGQIGVPSSVSMTVVRLVAIFLMVALLQFVAVVIFALANPAAKVRTGRPTATAQATDFYEQQYKRRA